MALNDLSIGPISNVIGYYITTILELENEIQSLT